MRWTHGLINRLAMFVDFTMLILGTTLVHAFWVGGSLSRLAMFCVLEAVIYLRIMKFGGAYRVENYGSHTRQIRQVSVGAVLTALAMTVIERALLDRAPDSGAAAVVMSFAAPFAALLAGRLVIVAAGMRYLSRRAVLRRRIVVVGGVAAAEDAIARLRGENPGFIECAGVFTDDAIPVAGTGADPSSSGPVPVLGTVEDLLGWEGRDKIDLVVVVLPWDDIGRLGTVLERYGRLSADVVVSLTHNEFRPRYAQVTRVGNLPVLQVVRQPLKGSLVFTKRLEDLTLAIAGLIFTSPILLLAALAIRIESPGPVLFRQRRMGRDNKPFTLYKFRTMRLDPADDGTKGTARGDPRITRVGAFLRGTSLDELPQLINVLEGSMSIVGPRPHVAGMEVGEGRHYDTVGAYMHRYRMKPGITGWAQINGMRGGIHSLEKAQRGVELDLYYVENWSLLLDIKIILLTLTRGMSGDDVF